MSIYEEIFVETAKIKIIYNFFNFFYCIILVNMVKYAKKKQGGKKMDKKLKIVIADDSTEFGVKATEWM